MEILTLFYFTGGMYIGQPGFAQVGVPGYQAVPAQGMNPCNVSINNLYIANIYIK